MSFTINTGKESTQARRPVLLADFTFSDGSVWRAASIDCTYGGHVYVPAIDPPEVERLQYLSEQGIDRVPSASVTIADPDGSIFATWERGATTGFKGATLLLRLVLRDVSTSEWSTDSLVPFIGTCDQPSVDAKGLKVSATNKLNLSQDHLPQTAICARCPWINPATTQQRTEAADPNSRFYRCGETRDLTTAPPCSYTKQTCTQPQRYGGSTWQPAKQGDGREYISANRIAWTNPDTSGKYKQYWPQWLGGAAWIDVPVLNQWADGNYTRGEAAIGIGPVNVLKVLANGIELSQGTTGDYRWHYVNNGARDGAHNTDTGYADGDPYGNETVIQFLAPHATLDPNSQAPIRVLARTDSAAASVAITTATGSGTGPIEINFGRLMGTGDPGDGALVTISGCSWSAVNGTFVLRYLDHDYTHAFLEGTIASGSGTGGTLYYSSASLAVGGAVPTPWVIQAALKATGRFSDPDFGTTWSTAGTIAGATISYTDGDGNEGSNARFGSSVALRDQRSVADIVRGLRQSMGALLYFGQDGKLEISVEGPLAEQQPSVVDGSNYNAPISSTLRDGTTANGYAAYHFDRSNSRNLQRTAQQNSTSPNKVSFTFLDPANDWAVSTFAEFDPEDVSRMEQETAGGLQVQPEGIASYNFAYRCARLGLNKVLRGNPAGDTRGTDWWQWEASFRGCKLRPGQIVLLTNSRLGLDHQQVRIASIKPSANYETVTITGHHHEDSWYLDAPSTLADPGRSYYHYTPPTPTTPGSPAPPDNVTIGTITVGDAHYTPTGTGGKRRLIGKRPISIAYAAPSPVGTFKGVYVSVAVDDGGATPAMSDSVSLGTSVSLAGKAPQQFGPFAYSDGASVSFEIDEPSWRTATSVLERATFLSYSDDVINDPSTSPSATFTLGAPETAKPGAATAHCQNPTAISKPATFADGTANPWLDTSKGGVSQTHLLVHQDAPDDPAFAGVAWRVSDDPDGLEIINASGPQKEADFELVFATPTSLITGYVWACGVDEDGNVNPIVPGITPMVTVTLGTTDGTVDLGAATVASMGLGLGSDGTSLNVKITGPLYTDVAGNIDLRIASDFVVTTVGGVQTLSQNIVDLTKATGFDTSQFDGGGGTSLVIKALAVNKLIAGDALFAGDVTLARSGGGKVTLNSAGLAIADNNVSPNSTVTLTSTGATILKGTNGVQVTASGVAINGPSGTLTATSTGVVISNGSNSVTVSSTAVTIANGTSSVTVTASAVTIVNGSLTSPTITGGSLTITSGTTTLNVDGSNFLMVTNSATSRRAQMTYALHRVEDSTNTLRFAQVMGFQFQAQNTVNSGATYESAVLSPYGLEIDGLPSSNPGAGTKKFWYDPSDGNRVKFAA